MRSKTKFITLTDQAPRVLFSVRENTEKAMLIISPPHAEYSFWNDGVRDKTVHRKFTVHRTGSDSELPGSNLLHYTSQSVGQDKFESHLLTRAVPGGLVEPLYFHSIRDSNTLNDRPSRASERVIQCCSYAPRLSVLHYGVLLAPAGANEALIAPSSMYTRMAIPFACYTLIMVIAFSHLASLPTGYLLSSSTASPWVGGKPVIDQFSNPSAGYGPVAAREEIEMRLGWQHRQVFEEAAKLAPHAIPFLQLIYKVGPQMAPLSFAAAS